MPRSHDAGHLRVGKSTTDSATTGGRCATPLGVADVRAVAAEIRQAVARSGLSRAEFASRIETSASRLSTYTTGKVTPAATLMVRIRRLLDPTGG